MAVGKARAKTLRRSIADTLVMGRSDFSDELQNEVKRILEMSR